MDTVNQTIRFYRRLLDYAILGLGALFVNSIWAQIPYPALDSLDSFLLLRCTFVLYMYCWYWGCSTDLDVQNDILVTAPSPSVAAVGLAAMMFVLFACLFWVGDPLILSVLFLVFLVANVAGWLYLKRHVRPFADLSEDTYEKRGDQLRKLKARVYRDYLFGRWQWWRFGAGIAMLLALIATAAGRIPLLPGISRSLAFSSLVLVTVLVLESWILFKRLKLKTLWTGLDWVRDNGFEIIESKSSTPARNI